MSLGLHVNPSKCGTDHVSQDLIDLDDVGQEGRVKWSSQFEGCRVARRAIFEDRCTSNHLQVKGYISRAGVISLIWDLQESVHTVRQPIAHQSAVLVEVLTDQFKGLGPVPDINHRRARGLRDLSLKVTLLAHGSKNSRSKISWVPGSGAADLVLNPVDDEFEMVFSYHRDLVALFAATRLACDGTELGNVGFGQ